MSGYAQVAVILLALVFISAVLVQQAREDERRAKQHKE